MKLSICMMVKNEESNMKRCLEALKKLTQKVETEIIIVDTGSEDKTVEIAREYTDKIFFKEWKENFSEIRNFTIECAKGQWVLIIDADEVLLDEEPIVEFLKMHDNNYKTGAIIVNNIINLNNESENIRITSPRIFKNTGEVKYSGAIHNEAKFGKPVAFVDAVLLHYGYVSTDKDLMEKKFQRTAKMLINELNKNPDNIYYRHQLSVSYGMHCDFKEALEEEIKAYEALKKQRLEPRRHLYIFQQLTKTYINNSRFGDAEKICLEGIDICSDYIDLYFQLGQISNNLKKYDAAIEAFNKYLQLIKNVNNTSVFKDGIVSFETLNFSELVYMDLAIIYSELRDWDKVLQYSRLVTDVSKLKGINFIIINAIYNIENYEELKRFYINKVLTSKDENFINEFINIVEQNNENVNEDCLKKIYNLFLGEKTPYGFLNRIRVEYEDNNLELERELEKFLNEYDLEQLPKFYGDIIYYLLYHKKPIADLTLRLSEGVINNYMDFLITRHADIYKVISEYLDYNIETDLFRDIKLKKILYKCLIIFHSVPDEIYLQNFYSFVKYGIKYIEYLYREDFLDEELINEVKSPEEGFFIYMYIGEKKRSTSEGDYAKYLKKALQIYPHINKGMELHFQKLYEQQLKIDTEFENIKAKAKENINVLINQGKLGEAINLIKEFESIVENDEDIYSMKAIAYIMNKQFFPAEEVLKKALSIYPNNSDLLFNMCYLKEQQGKLNEAIEFYSKGKMFNLNSDVTFKSIVGDKVIDKSDNMKVLHGTIEIANQMSICSSGLNKIGVHSKTVCYYPTYLNYKADYFIDINSCKNNNEAQLKTKELAAELIPQFNLFHFHFGTSLALDYSDLSLLKELNKKVIMQHWGSDIRLYSKALELNPYIKVKETNEDNIKTRLEFLSKHISNCIVSDYEMYRYVENYYKNIHVVAESINVKDYEFLNNYDLSKKLLIVHAPTHRGVKGSEFIIKAIEDLKLKYDFDFKLIEFMSHKEAKEIYKQADLVIDQIVIGCYGLVSIENMALGKPVIAYVMDYMKDKYPKELPIICANPDNIKEKIEYAIKNRDMFRELGERGRKYVEDYHDSNKVIYKFLEIYKNLE